MQTCTEFAFDNVRGLWVCEGHGLYIGCVVVAMVIAVFGILILWRMHYMAQVKASFSINVISAPLKLDETPLADALVNLPYSAQLKAEGGKPPYAFGIDSGSLPSGLSLDPVSGAITGTPTTVAPGTPFEIVLTDQGV